MARYKPPSIRDKGLKHWIDDGKRTGKWPHDYAKFEEMRHTLGMKKTQIQKNFNLKSWHAIREWFAIDDEEHHEQKG